MSQAVLIAFSYTSSINQLNVEDDLFELYKYFEQRNFRVLLLTDICKSSKDFIDESKNNSCYYYTTAENIDHFHVLLEDKPTVVHYLGHTRNQHLILPNLSQCPLTKLRKIIETKVTKQTLYAVEGHLDLPFKNGSIQLSAKPIDNEVLCVNLPGKFVDILKSNNAVFNYLVYTSHPYIKSIWPWIFGRRYEFFIDHKRLKLYYKISS